MLEELTLTESLVCALFAPALLTGSFYLAEKISELYDGSSYNVKRLMHLYDEGLIETRPNLFNSRRISKYVEDMQIWH